MTAKNEGRRDRLKVIGRDGGTHAGLWLDKYLKELRHPDGKKGEDAERGNNQGEALRDLLVEAAGTPIPYGYRAALERRRALLGEYRGGVEGGMTRLFTAEARGRLVVGLGTQAIRETNITLLHTWGVPYLPGSALKGVASAAAHRLSGGAPWNKAAGDVPQGEDHALLFGSTEAAGFVVFHDAWWVPEPHDTSLPLDLDVMTVHHRDYYRDGKSAPADWDEPNPVAFLTARGKYLVALTGPKAWVESAGAWLARGLGELGIGAKTQAGYGRMALSAERTRKEIEDEALFEKHRARLRALDDLAKQRTAANTARQHIQKLREALSEGVPAAGVYAAARRLARENPKFWRDWAKELRRTEEEKVFLAESGMLNETVTGKKQ
jgi:CRISPR-associated protein Cmr6